MSTVQRSAVLLGVVLCVTGGLFQAPINGQEPTPPQSEKSSDPLEVRFARNSVLLTEARLRQAEEKNRRTPNSISPRELDGLRGNVQLTKQLLASAERGEVQNRNDIFLRYAELSVDLAQQRLNAAVEARRLAPSTHTAADIEVLRLQVEQAKLTLAMGQKAVSMEPDDELRWKVDLMMEEILKIRRELRQLRR